jgi:hypothetical protein
VVGILQEQFLLLQPGDELGPARLDGIAPGLGKGGERELLEDWHVGSPLLDETSPILITCMTLYTAPAERIVGLHKAFRGT